MKKTLFILYISLFVIVLVFAGCDKPRPEWVDLERDKNTGAVYSVNVASITKIQKEAADQNIRINSPALVKRDVYAVWVKMDPGNQTEGTWKNVDHTMMRYFVDVANHEFVIGEAVLYYKTGGNFILPPIDEVNPWRGPIPETPGEEIFKIVAKYK